MSNFFKEFTNMYSGTRTLRFELKPVGETLENILKSNVLLNDEERAKQYEEAKKTIDKYHKNFIEEVLSDIDLNNAKEEIQTYFEQYRKKENTKETKKIIQNCQKLLSKYIVEKFKSHSKYKPMFQKELIQKDLPDFIGELISEEDGETKQEALEKELENIKNFNHFTTYFKGFHDNRENIYKLSAPKRVIEENLPRFFDNLIIFEKLQKEKELLQKCNQALLNLKFEKTMEEVFSLEYFTKTLTQSGIDTYNLAIGGMVDEQEKIKALNEIINEFNQINKDNKEKKIPKFKVLYKQILSDKKSYSFILDSFKDDNEFATSLEDFFSYIDEKDILKKAKELFENVENWEGIWVKKTELNTISNALFGDFNIINIALEEYCKVNIIQDNKKTKALEKKEQDFLQQEFFELTFLNTVLKEYGKALDQTNEAKIQIENKTIFSYFENIMTLKDNKKEDVFSLINTSKTNLKALLLEFSKKEFKTFTKAEVVIIKEPLDELIKLSRIFKSLNIPDDFLGKKNNDFYDNFLVLHEELSTVARFYDKVRNHVTRKPYSMTKIKINFDNPTLLNGWDVNKEKDNSSIILKKGENYFLGIVDKKHKKIFDNPVELKEDECYEKMYYKLIPGPNKMLPKVFFCKTHKTTYQPSSKLLEDYEKGKHKKGETFDISFCHELIDFFKICIEKHPDWKHFNFVFSPTSQYQDISFFYKEVEKQGYKLEFKNFSKLYIDGLVENGKLFLFQIYNKDFSPSHDKKEKKTNPNLHTIYWKMLFDKENLENTVYKLNGEAEIFYRKSSIEEKITHAAGEQIRRKNDLKDLSKKSIFKYDIIKDKRFTKDKFFFHVPITTNFKSKEVPNINTQVNEFLKQNEDINIIGLDRGEKNLLYYTVINQDKEIIEQNSFNSVDEVNYHEKLDNKEKERFDARVNWQSVENIKELKAGYLSQIVHKLTTLMLKHKAIIVLENLNLSFKQTRVKFEKQVYQKFEKAMIEKLNYLVIKNNSAKEPAGALNALQLVNKFDTFDKIGRQTGFLFYIPAWNTSKIDPTTGYVKFLNIKYKNIDDSKKVFSYFDSILFDKSKECFVFTFNYKTLHEKNFLGSKSYFGKEQWSAYTKGNLRYRWNGKENVPTDVTQELKELFKENKIDIEKKDFKEDIAKSENANFFKNLISLLNCALSLRHSGKNKVTGENDDFILSPVLNKDEYFFDSRAEKEKKEKATLPIDSDANGAYHIALKGLWLLEAINEAEDSKKIELTMSNAEWIKYMQTDK